MATTNSKNKWLILLAVILTAIVIYAYKKYDDRKFDDRVTADCQNKKYYQLPMLSLVNRDSADLKAAVVAVRRNGKTVKTELSFKKTINKDHSVNLDLSSISSAPAIVQQQDTILIQIGNEKHVITGFSSNTVRVDHGVLLCLESYQLEGRYFNSDRPNSIGKNGKPAQ